MKRLITIVLVLCLVLALAPAALAANETYVALGDSVTSGYGLSDTSKAYPSLLSKKWDVTASNVASPGKTSGELLAELNSGVYSSAIRSASVVTLNIGLNDILDPVIAVAEDLLGVDLSENAGEKLVDIVGSKSGAELIALLNAFEEALETEETKGMLNGAIDAYANNWDGIIKSIRSINPKAKIIATNLYNPLYPIYFSYLYQTIVDFRSITDKYIRQMNSALSAHNSKVGGYTLVSIYSAFNADGMTNTVFSIGVSLDPDTNKIVFSPNVKLDPHPSEKGHSAIADAIYSTVPSIKDTEPVPQPTGSLENFKRKTTYANGMFTDVDETGKWYGAGAGRQGVIKAVYEYGLMDGMGEGLFAPEGELTIAQAITLACRIHNIYNGGTGVFAASVPWYTVYIEYALANGIIEPGDFSDYNKVATRAETAYIFANALPVSEFDAVRTVTSVPDVKSTDKYYDEIMLLYRAGVLSGNDDAGTFTPNASLQRCAAAAIAARIIKIVDRQTHELAA